MFILRETERDVTDISLDVGFTSLGTFSRTFRQIVGETPSAYRQGHGPIVAPHCVQLAAMRELAPTLAYDAACLGDGPRVLRPGSISLSQLRESFVNLTVTRGYGKRKGEKDLSKLTSQVYIYAIPYLWAFPPHEQIFGTTAIVPRHVQDRGGPAELGCRLGGKLADRYPSERLLYGIFAGAASGLLPALQWSRSIPCPDTTVAENLRRSPPLPILAPARGGSSGCAQLVAAWIVF